MIFSCRPDRGASWHLAQRPSPSRLPTGSPPRPAAAAILPWTPPCPASRSGALPPWSSYPPACPVCHRRHTPMSLPPANWLPCSPTGPFPSPLDVPAPRPARWATTTAPPRPSPPRLPTGSPLRPWHVAACGRPVDRAHVLDFTKSRWMHNWPLCLHARRTRSPWCIGASPLYRPGAAGLANGGVFTNRAKDRADAQRLVATRLLDRLHDPLGHISRLQRIHPRAR